MKPIAAKALTQAGNSSMHDIMSDGAVWNSQALFPMHLETVWNGLKGVGISWHGPKPGMILTLYEWVRGVCSNSIRSSGVGAMEERQQKWLKRTRRFTRALSLWQQVRIESFPDLLWLALVVHGFHDDFYKKNTTPESSWNETRNQRSYEDVLRPHLGAHQCPSAILDRQYTLQFCRVGRSRSQKNGLERQTSLRALLSQRMNWENTDRASLLMDEIAELVAIRKGCILTLARFASAELNRRVRVALVFPSVSGDGALTKWWLGAIM